MRIIFFSHYFFPHTGGVEKHVLLLSKKLIAEGHKVYILTYRFNNKLKTKEIINGIKIIRFTYPKKKLLGLFSIWSYLWRNRNLVKGIDVVHIHDVFIWYLPFRFLFPTKKVFLTIHGLEWGNPFSWSGMLQKKIAIKLSSGTIGIGKFLEKYIGVKFDVISYGAVEILKYSNRKTKDTILFLGRLDKDTGVLKFLNWLDKNKKLKVNFAGDGKLKRKCAKYGKVYGFVNPEKLLARTEFVVPGGYLACLEAFSYKCKVKIFWQDNLKKDYWQLSPMYKLIKDGNVKKAFNWVKKQNWDKLTKEYTKLWNI